MNSYLLRGYVYEDENGQFCFTCKCCDLQFAQLDLLQDHISKMRIAPQITELPDECLTKIFSYFAPNELVNLLQVCTKFKATAEKVFELYCDPGPIEIPMKLFWKLKEGKNEDDDDFELFEDAVVHCNFRFKCKSHYEIAFHSFLRRLVVPEAIVGYKELFQFIRDNCSKNLISLIIYGCLITDSTYTDGTIYGELIKDQLKNLKHLRVKNASYENLYDQLLKYTEQLKVLNVINYCLECRHREDGICSHFDSSWTNHSYPELESIYLHTLDNSIDLMPMIRRHPKLRNVACNSIETIRSIIESDIKFNYIAFVFRNGTNGSFSLGNFRRLHRNFVKFGRSKKFDKFELCFDETPWCNLDLEDAKLIKKIPNVTGLHIHGSNLEKIVENGVKLTLIDKLCMTYTRSYSEDVKELTQKVDEYFPNLKELRINGRNMSWPACFRHSSSFKSIAKAIFSDPLRFRNLRQVLYEHDDDVAFSLDDISDINLSRSARPNTSKITVYLDPVHFHKFNKTVIEYEFIEVRPWVHGGCELCVDLNSLR